MLTSYILGKETNTCFEKEADVAARQEDERNKRVAFKICAPFTDCIRGKYNTKINNTKDLDVSVSMYNLKGYSEVINIRKFMTILQRRAKCYFSTF